MDMRRRLLMMLYAGGDDMLPEKEYFTTLTEEMTLKDFLTANPVPLKYESEICWLRFFGQHPITAQTGTIRSMSWAAFFVTAGQKEGFLLNYANGARAPDDFVLINSVSAYNGSYFVLTDNRVTSSSSTNALCRIAAGNDAYVLHIPFDWDEFSMHTDPL